MPHVLFTDINQINSTSATYLSGIYVLTTSGNPNGWGLGIRPITNRQRADCEIVQTVTLWYPQNSNHYAKAGPVLYIHVDGNVHTD